MWSVVGESRESKDEQPNSVSEKHETISGDGEATLEEVESTEKSETVEKSKTTRKIFNVGDRAKLYADDGSAVIFATSESAFRKWHANSVAGDDLGLREMAFAGELMATDADTNCLILERSYSMVSVSFYKVRLLDGTYSGDLAWVMMTNVVPQSE
ncbi:hypothetical protein KOR42_41830 [Thalassoglobus neptunius]|uniref:Uncharacterized protein n=2 Tax=Thalassoglobus neptunius TaxID=1938619 RepID=A0A5C5WAN8_9PLAN|nr:hypothetical protein KOR42_41830 [Thalassoglobus neptunius]